MANDDDWSLTIKIDEEGKIEAKAGGGGESPASKVDFGRHETRKTLVGLLERMLREAKLTKEAELQALGTLLYEMIFPGPIDAFFVDHLHQFEKERKSGPTNDPAVKGQRLRVTLQIRNSLLAGMPWEFLYRPGEGTGESFFLASRTKLVLTRYIGTQKDRPKLVTTEELKVLVVDMLSLPEVEPAGWGLPVVFEDLVKKLREQQEEDRRLSGQGGSRVAFNAMTLRSPNGPELMDALAQFQPHVLHYISRGSHAESSHRISLGGEKPGDPPMWLERGEFANLFQNYQPKLVFLHLWQSPEFSQADFVSLAPALIDTEIRAVVALSYPLGLEAAKRFIACFYLSLLNCETVAAAVQEGRHRLSIGNTSCVGSPVLFLQSRDGPLASFPVRRQSASGMPPGPGILPRGLAPLPGGGLASAMSPSANDRPTAAGADTGTSRWSEGQTPRDPTSERP